MPRLLLALLAAAVAAPAAAQTVRFQTSVGAFDMLLNPTNNANLDPLVDNLLANVAAGVYHRSVVNRAARQDDGSDFVLQIGSFQTSSVDLDAIPQFGFASTNSFDSVVVDANDDGNVDFSTAGLTNTRGTVSLALSAAGPNSGSASFFVNLGDNSFLDAQGFVPFAQVSDLTTIDRIMNQQIVDLSASVGQNGSLAYSDVPLADDGDLIVIESAAVISEASQVFVGPLRQAFGFGEAVETTETAATMTDPSLPSTEEIERIIAEGGDLEAALGLPSTAASAATAVPEPTAILLAGIALLAARRRA